MELPPTDTLVDKQRDALYSFNEKAQKASNAEKPWKSDPNYFKTVRIGATALVKMVMHARSGGSIEVMGLMQGYVDGTALVVTDAYRLPVEGTETRVNAQDDANEYMVEYLRLCREESRQENVVGWYHSHPGYGCWLSGIDVSTEAMQQQFNDPFVAVVVDPDRTISAEKVEIGAFRTYPENYSAPSAAARGGVDEDGYQSVPLAKVEDFGAHSSRYYPLEVEHFKSTLDSKLLDLLWNKYWVQTLAQNPLLTNREFGNKQMVDLGYRIKEVTNGVTRTGGSRGPLAHSSGGGGGGAPTQTPLDQNVQKLVRDVSHIATKERAGLMAGEVKTKLFSQANGKCGCSHSSS